MSHKVTFKSEFKDSGLLKAALEAYKCTFQENGESLHITSGPLARATVNVATGEITSDSDYHTKEQLGVLRQHYSEAEFRRMALREGVTIQSRQILKNGSIKLVCTG